MCIIPVCDKPTKARGLCGGHYYRWMRGDGPLANQKLRDAPTKTKLPCSVEGCEDPAFARSWCKRHYERWRDRGGDPGINLRETESVEAANRRILDDLKSKPCMDCGNCFPTVCMDFDHRPGSGKLFNISRRRTASTAELLAEIAKCDLVCSNCHRIRTRDRGKA